MEVPKAGGGQSLWKMLDQWLKLKLLSVLCMIWWAGALIHDPCLQLLFGGLREAMAHPD
jgi:hypothetical protein